MRGNDTIGIVSLKSSYRLLAALAIPLAAVALSAQAIDDQEGELKEVRRKLAEARARAQELKSQEQSILEQLERTAEEVNLTRQVLNALRSKESRLNNEIKQLDGQLLVTESGLVRQEAIMQTRLREIYKRGRVYEWEYLISERSLAEVARRYRYLALIAQQDRRLCAGIRAEKAGIVRDKADRESKLMTLAEVKGETEREMENLKDDEARQKKLLDKVRQEKKSKEALAKELAAAAKKLQKLIEELERKRKAELARRKAYKPLPGTTYLEKNQGALDWPCDGTLYSDFGLKKHNKYNTYIQNNGLDIMSHPGAQVRAVANGTVAYAERFLGYGNVILVDHQSGFYTLYGNLSEMLVVTGSPVANNQVIGTVGGSVDGPILHFEVRKGGKPVDPQEWLKRRR
ncbi:MAG: peptidoglycan DD-metalloendopeptidase family protein [Candidatus Edwardsbacteria bacterium]|nr:peptidoglycan DD-metalloendopeptidase family protein [Candidatus Edwardsbacteria bacterium]